MRSPILAIAILLSSMTTNATDNDGRGQSIMFGDKPGNEYEHLTTQPREKSVGERCVEMARQVERLKGKPQRRSAMAARYREECELR